MCPKKKGWVRNLQAEMWLPVNSSVSNTPREQRNYIPGGWPVSSLSRKGCETWTAALGRKRIEKRGRRGRETVPRF